MAVDMNDSELEATLVQLLCSVYPREVTVLELVKPLGTRGNRQSIKKMANRILYTSAVKKGYCTCVEGEPPRWKATPAIYKLHQKNNQNSALNTPITLNPAPNPTTPPPPIINPHLNIPGAINLNAPCTVNQVSGSMPGVFVRDGRIGGTVPPMTVQGLNTNVWEAVQVPSVSVSHGAQSQSLGGEGVNGLGPEVQRNVLAGRMHANLGVPMNVQGMGHGLGVSRTDTVQGCVNLRHQSTSETEMSSVGGVFNSTQNGVGNVYGGDSHGSWQPSQIPVASMVMSGPSIHVNPELRSKCVGNGNGSRVGGPIHVNPGFNATHAQNPWRLAGKDGGLANNFNSGQVNVGAQTTLWNQGKGSGEMHSPTCEMGNSGSRIHVNPACEFNAKRRPSIQSMGSMDSLKGSWNSDGHEETIDTSCNVMDIWNFPLKVQMGKMRSGYRSRQSMQHAS